MNRGYIIKAQSAERFLQLCAGRCHSVTEQTKGVTDRDEVIRENAPRGFIVKDLDAVARMFIEASLVSEIVYTCEISSW